MEKVTIRIDTDRCFGCPECVSVCPQRALGIVDGKAVLLHPQRCHGKGGCIHMCPMGAISSPLFGESKPYCYLCQ